MYKSLCLALAPPFGTSNALLSCALTDTQCSFRGIDPAERMRAVLVPFDTT